MARSADAVPAGVFRLLDANLNRAREGLRVLEDTARFVWEDRTLFEPLRDARHGLDRVTRRSYPRLLAARNSAEDAGRRLPESRRRDWSGLVAANFRRVEEALRVLEEYGKVFAPRGVAALKSLRYRLYVLEASVSGGRPPKSSRRRGSSNAG